MLPVTSLPVWGSIGGAPEMKTNPFALTAAEMGTLYFTKASEMPGTWTVSFMRFSCDRRDRAPSGTPLLFHRQRRQPEYGLWEEDHNQHHDRVQQQKRNGGA